jgi:hypothetical protein
VGAAARFGIYGWPVLNMAPRMLIFSALLAVSVWAAFATAHQMRPGSRTTPSGVLLLLTLLAMEVVFFLVFDDYSLGQFFRAGLRCLGLGMLTAVPAGRGVAVGPPRVHSCAYFRRLFDRCVGRLDGIIRAGTALLPS